MSRDIRRVLVTENVSRLERLGTDFTTSYSLPAPAAVGTDCRVSAQANLSDCL